MSKRTTALVTMIGLTLALMTACGSAQGGQAQLPPVVTTGPANSTSTPRIVTDLVVLTPDKPVDGALSVDGFTAKILWETGSAASPSAYQWTFTVTGHDANFVWEPWSVGEEKSWSRAFTLTDEQISSLVADLNAAGVTGEIPADTEFVLGGAFGGFELSDASGVHVKAALGMSGATTDLLNSVESAALDVIPTDVYDSVKAEYDAWVKTQN